MASYFQPCRATAAGPPATRGETLPAKMRRLHHILSGGVGESYHGVVPLTHSGAACSQRLTAQLLLVLGHDGAREDL